MIYDEMTNEDFDALGRAMRQLNETGNITEKCPRCGLPIIFEQDHSLEITRCTNKDCIKRVVRGI